MKLAWSNRAKEDLDDLQRYSVGRWGRDVALRYLENVRFAAKSFADNPGRARPLKGAFRILRVRSHCLLIYVDTSRNASRSLACFMRRWISGATCLDRTCANILAHGLSAF